jgi:hypothetical protein
LLGLASPDQFFGRARVISTPFGTRRTTRCRTRGVMRTRRTRVTLGRPPVVPWRGRYVWSAIAVAFNSSMTGVVWDNIPTAGGFPSRQEDDDGSRGRLTSSPARWRFARGPCGYRKTRVEPARCCCSLGRSISEILFPARRQAPQSDTPQSREFGALGQGRGGNVLPMSYPISSDKDNYDRFSNPVCGGLPEYPRGDLNPLDHLAQAQ